MCCVHCKPAWPVAPLRKPRPDGGLAILRDTDLRACLAELACPVLLQYGERDRMTPPQAGEWLAAQLDAQLILHPGAGHAPFISHEAAFLAAQQDFLARV